MSQKNMITLSFVTAVSIAQAAYAPTALAHDGFNTDCNTNIESEMSFSNNQLTVWTQNKQAITFDKAGYISVDGETLSLNSSQQQLAKSYYQDVESAIPMVVNVTVEALEVTNIALTAAFTGLLGEDSELPRMIGSKLEEISKAIEDHVYQDTNSLTFNSTYFEQDLGFDENIDEEIEAIQEEIMSTAMGEVFMALGKAMISGDTDFSNFEQRMEKLGEEIEMKADALAEELEETAKDLCETLQRIDSTENELQSIKGLKDLNMIETHQQKA